MSAPTNTAEAHDAIEPQHHNDFGGLNSNATGHGYDEPQKLFAGGVGSHIRDDQYVAETLTRGVVAEQSDSSNAVVTPGPVSGDSSTTEVAPGRATNIRGGQEWQEAHCRFAAAEQSPPAPASVMPADEPKTHAPVLADPLLALAADVLDDLECVRIANENRLRQLTRVATDKDGEERGFGLDESHPDVARLAALVASLAKAEHDAELQLKRQLRAHSLGPWVRRTQGVGEKQAARLLAAIRDPYWNDLHDRPRTVSELWAYCGYHVVSASHRVIDTHSRDAGGIGGDPGHTRIDDHKGRAGVAATPKRGQKLNWSATAKMRIFLIAESCVKKRDSPYRKVYDDTREKYADAVHAVECKRCGPSGKPAQPGSPISAGHQHARALRAVSKAVLKDIWIEARRIHEEGA